MSFIKHIGNVLFSNLALCPGPPIPPRPTLLLGCLVLIFPAIFASSIAVLMTMLSILDVANSASEAFPVSNPLVPSFSILLYTIGTPLVAGTSVLFCLVYGFIDLSRFVCARFCSTAVISSSNSSNGSSGNSTSPAKRECRHGGKSGGSVHVLRCKACEELHQILPRSMAASTTSHPRATAGPGTNSTTISPQSPPPSHLQHLSLAHTGTAATAVDHPTPLAPTGIQFLSTSPDITSNNRDSNGDASSNNNNNSGIGLYEFRAQMGVFGRRLDYIASARASPAPAVVMTMLWAVFAALLMQDSALIPCDFLQHAIPQLHGPLTVIVAPGPVPASVTLEQRTTEMGSGVSGGDWKAAQSAAASWANACSTMTMAMYCGVASVALWCILAVFKAVEAARVSHYFDSQFTEQMLDIDSEGLAHDYDFGINEWDIYEDVVDDDNGDSDSDEHLENNEAIGSADAGNTNSSGGQNNQGTGGSRKSVATKNSANTNSGSSSKGSRGNSSSNNSKSRDGKRGWIGSGRSSRSGGGGVVVVEPSGAVRPFKVESPLVEQAAMNEADPDTTKSSDTPPAFVSTAARQNPLYPSLAGVLNDQPSLPLQHPQQTVLPPAGSGRIHFADLPQPSVPIKRAPPYGFVQPDQSPPQQQQQQQLGGITRSRSAFLLIDRIKSRLGEAIGSSTPTNNQRVDNVLPAMSPAFDTHADTYPPRVALQDGISSSTPRVSSSSPTSITRSRSHGALLGGNSHAGEASLTDISSPGAVTIINQARSIQGTNSNRNSRSMHTVSTPSTTAWTPPTQQHGLSNRSQQQQHQSQSPSSAAMWTTPERLQQQSGMPLPRSIRLSYRESELATAAATVAAATAFATAAGVAAFHYTNEFSFDGTAADPQQQVSDTATVPNSPGEGIAATLSQLPLPPGSSIPATRTNSGSGGLGILMTPAPSTNLIQAVASLVTGGDTAGNGGAGGEERQSTSTISDDPAGYFRAIPRSRR